MTNLEWIRTLSAKELSDLLYDYWLPRGQYVWTDSRKGLVKMLGETYLERDCDKCKHQGNCYCVKGLGCPFDPKTKPSNSEKPNICEVKNYCDDCLYTDTCDSKEFFYACTSKATISKMEQVDKDINVRSKDERQTEGVWNAGYKTGYDKGYKDAQKVKDSQDLVKDLVKAFCEDGTWLERQGVYTLTLAEAKQRAVDIIESVIAKDEPTTQTETQNSNLTFEKDECAKEYEELGLKELKELIKADRKDEPQTDTEIAKTIVHKMIDDAVIAEDAYPDLRQKMHDAVDEYEPQTDCAWR